MVEWVRLHGIRSIVVVTVGSRYSLDRNKIAVIMYMDIRRQI